MGINCCKETQKEDPNVLAKGEQEIEFAEYTSSNDKLVQKIEQNYNLLTHLQLYYYLNHLDTFSIETATLKMDPKEFKTEFSSKGEFDKLITVDEFQSFLENRILKEKELYTMAGEDESLTSTFKDILLGVYNDLSMKVGQYRGEIKPTLKKLHLIPLALLFCISTNIAKVKLFFDLFAEDGKLKQSKELDEFVISLFITASFCMVSSRIKLGKRNQKIGAVEANEAKKAVSCSELKDNQEVLKVFKETFFKKDELTFDEVKSLFENKKEGFGWMFNSKGVRNMLEKHNI